jgi:ubiquinol-cytochrome c reductase cytochrome c subunit
MTAPQRRMRLGPLRRPAGPPGKLRRRISTAARLLGALIVVGGLYTVFTPSPQATAQDEPTLSTAAQEGKRLYETACITCHGQYAQGVPSKGPSLIGVGSAAVEFQVSSGRMPLARQEAQGIRKPPLPIFDPATADGAANLEALGAFIEANGGGPTVPAATGEALRGNDPARGGELFRLNCASCHNFTGRGGALSSGKFAPPLDPASETQIYAAMLTGPQNMPKFTDRQLAPEEKKDIIAYIKSVSGDNNNPGGNPIGGIGPVSEGVIAFVVGLAGLIGFALWLGAKS